MKYKLIILFFLFTYTAVLSIPKYEDFYNLVTDLTDVSSDSLNNIIIVGSEGAILVSHDAGYSWEQKYVGTNRNIVDVEHLSGDVFIALNQFYNIFKTMDAGNTWSSIPITSSSEMTCFSLSCEAGIIGNFNGEVLVSNDSSKSWAVIKISNSKIQKVLCTGKYYLAVDINNDLFYTNDLNNQWNKLKVTNSTALVNDIVIDNNANLFFLYDNFVVKYDKNINKTNEYPTPKTVLSLINSKENEYYLYSFDKGTCFYDKKIEKYKLTYTGAEALIEKDSIINDTIHSVYNSAITKVVSINKNEQMAIGKNKSIFISKDKGNSWEMKSFFSTFYLDYKNYPKVCLTENNIFIGIPRMGLIYRSTDRGATWLYQDNYAQNEIPNFLELYDMKFFNDSCGMIYGLGAGYLWFTNNCAKTFTFKRFDSLPSDDNRMCSPKEKCYAIAGNFNNLENFYKSFSTVKITNNDWETYTTYNMDSCFIFSIAAIDDSSYVITSLKFPIIDSSGNTSYLNPNIAFTRDYGKTWIKNEIDSVLGISNMKYINKDIGFMTYTNKDKIIYLARTENGGKSWQNLLSTFSNSSTYQRWFRFIEMDQYGTGFTSNDYDSLYETNDFGTTWQFTYIPKTLSVSCFNKFKNAYYIFGVNDLIMRTVSNDSTLIVKEKINEVDTKMIVRKPYPVPFSTQINIPLFWASGIGKEEFKINVYNIMGDLVDTIPNSAMISTGLNSATIKWSPSNKFNSGVYIISIRVQGNESNTNVLYSK
jgi:photosystem II stability/assembly factor-like uncharacterized protein